MRTIHKYHLRALTGEDQDIPMPKGAVILALQAQNDVGTLWALVDPIKASEVRTFRVFGTGFPIDGVHHTYYVGSYQAEGGAFVWHVFEVLKKGETSNG